MKVVEKNPDSVIEVIKIDRGDDMATLVEQYDLNLVINKEFENNIIETLQLFLSEGVSDMSIEQSKSILAKIKNVAESGDPEKIKSFTNKFKSLKIKDDDLRKRVRTIGKQLDYSDSELAKMETDIVKLLGVMGLILTSTAIIPLTLLLTLLTMFIAKLRGYSIKESMTYLSRELAGSLTKNSKGTHAIGFKISGLGLITMISGVIITVLSGGLLAIVGLPLMIAGVSLSVIGFISFILTFATVGFRVE